MEERRIGIGIDALSDGNFGVVNGREKWSINVWREVLWEGGGRVRVGTSRPDRRRKGGGERYLVQYDTRVKGGRIGDGTV